MEIGITLTDEFGKIVFAFQAQDVRRYSRYYSDGLLRTRWTRRVGYAVFAVVGLVGFEGRSRVRTGDGSRGIWF